MSKSDSLVQKIFDAYTDGDKDLISTLDAEKDEVFLKYYDEVDKGEADPEELNGVQYAVARAAFYAGFNAAKELLR